MQHAFPAEITPFNQAAVFARISTFVTVVKVLFCTAAHVKPTFDRVGNELSSGPNVFVVTARKVNFIPISIIIIIIIVIVIVDCQPCICLKKLP